VLIALLIALVAVNIAYLVLLDRRDARDRVERATLHQRLQAPHAAVAEHHAQVVPPVPAGSPLPMSDEEMAEMMNGQIPDSQSELARVIARMEAEANGFEQIQDGVLP
jgi:hypothetical protein